MNPPSQAISDELVETVARAVERDPTEEPRMPGLSAHFPEIEYHGAAQYRAKCDCGFKTKPGNYYVAKAEWAAHALEASGIERLLGEKERMRGLLDQSVDMMNTMGPRMALQGGEIMIADRAGKLLDEIRTTLSEVQPDAGLRKGDG